MLAKMMAAGMHDACAALGVDFEKVAGPQLALPGLGAAARMAAPNASLWAKARTFGGGQLDAARSLFRNTRGALGGAANPDVVTGAVPAQSAGLARGAQRTVALQNLKTLAPSLAMAGGAYLLSRDGKAEQERQQAPLQPRPY